MQSIGLLLGGDLLASNEAWLILVFPGGKLSAASFASTVLSITCNVLGCNGSAVGWSSDAAISSA